MRRYLILTVILLSGLFLFQGSVSGESPIPKENIYNLGTLKPIDSTLKVNAGDEAPDFTLPSVSGKKVSLSEFKGKKNVVISFVPAAWTPICSQQWPGYNLVQGVFDDGDAVMLGISVDNIPTLHAWTRQMGQVWFEVLSDFWPHGAVADQYGVLRSDGLCERAVFVIDKEGIVRAALVTDINKKPDFEPCAAALKKLEEE